MGLLTKLRRIVRDFRDVWAGRPPEKPMTYQDIVNRREERRQHREFLERIRRNVDKS